MRALIIFNVLLLTTFLNSITHAQTSTLPIKGWAKNSVNAPIFRKNSVVTHNSEQYTAFYNGDGFVVLGKRTLGTTSWTTKTTTLKGKVTDAHNSISMMVDGAGFLHLSWDHHNNALNYCKSTAPGSLEMGIKTSMLGSLETSVSYPEFHRLPNGDLIFMYRDGASGNGNLVINTYQTQQKKWTRLHNSLISGEGLRNAYWQAFVDSKGVVHVSWVWRETSDVASNHDMCYARSTDGGKTWKKTSDASYTIPITATTAEYALKIPQNSELINQTSMYGDSLSRPYICSYWTPTSSNVPQYQVVYHDGTKWLSIQASQRTTPFSLSGSGTKKIPISRPQIVARQVAGKVQACIVYRDVEQGDKPSLLYTTDIKSAGSWKTINLSTEFLGSWEPSFDTELWKSKQLLHVFVQRVGQGDGETLEQLDPQNVTILEWKPESVLTGWGDKKLVSEKTMVYPNPFQDHFTLHTDDQIEYWMYSEFGNLVENGTAVGNINLGVGLGKGLYLLKWREEDEWKWSKLIKLD